MKVVLIGPLTNATRLEDPRLSRPSAAGSSGSTRTAAARWQTQQQQQSFYRLPRQFISTKRHCAKAWQNLQEQDVSHWPLLDMLGLQARLLIVSHCAPAIEQCGTGQLL